MDSLRAAETAIERLRNFKLRLETEKFSGAVNQILLDRAREAGVRFDEAMDDDLNTAEALAAAFELVRDANSAMDAGEFAAANAAPVLEFLSRFDAVFDVLRAVQKESGIGDAEIDALITERNQARKAKNFARSDEIRKQLLEGGVILEDTKEGTRWKRK